MSTIVNAANCRATICRSCLRLNTVIISEAGMYSALVVGTDFAVMELLPEESPIGGLIGWHDYLRNLSQRRDQMIARSLLTVAVLVLYSVAFAKEAALTSNRQKASYVLGLQTVLRLRHQEIRIDGEALLSGIGDALADRDPKLSKEEIVAAYAWQLDELNKRRTAKAERALTASQTFLKQNRGKEGVEELASGLQYQMLAEGAGARPRATDKVKVRYRGTFTNGLEFDNSERRRNAAVLAIPQLVKGLQEALQLMSEGAKWRIFIPPNLAHVTDGSPDGKIGPNEALVYEVALLSIVKSDEQKPSGNRPTVNPASALKRGKATIAN